MFFSRKLSEYFAAIRSIPAFAEMPRLALYVSLRRVVACDGGADTLALCSHTVGTAARMDRPVPYGRATGSGLGEAPTGPVTGLFAPGSGFTTP